MTESREKEAIQALIRQITWARDRALRGEQLAKDDWSRFLLSSLRHALNLDHPLLYPYEEEILAGEKFDQEKPRTDLLPSEPLLNIARVLGHGANKYGPHNWRAGLATSRLYAATLRHLLAWNDGEDDDQESGLPHLAHAACELVFLIQTLKDRPNLDDRYRRPEVESPADV